jgi:outer membrane protein assembly factor BamB
LNPHLKFALSSFITGGLLIGGVLLKQRELSKSLQHLGPVLSVGSVWIMPSAKAPVAKPRADARVSSGRPHMLHLDPARTNRSPFLAPRNPVLAWSFDAHSPIETAPAVLDNGTIVFGTLGGKLFAVRPDGSKDFERDLSNRIYSSPLVFGGSVFFGTDNHRFFSFSPTGEQRFVLGTDGDADTAAAPTPWGAVTFASGTVVYALKKDRTVAWRVKGKRKFYSSPAVGDDGTVYVASQDNRLYAIDKSGKVRFSVELGNDADCAPAVGDDGSVFVGTDGGSIVAVAASDGRIRWTAHTEGHVRGSVTLSRNGAVVVGTYGPVPQVISIDSATGAQRFAYAIQGTGTREFGIHGSPVEDANGDLCFGAQDDMVRCLDASGAPIFSFMTGGDVDAPVVLSADGVLLAASDDGKLYCLRDAAVTP